jgi:hypothetical protein
MARDHLTFHIRATRLTPLPTGSYELVLTLTPSRGGGGQGTGPARPILHRPARASRPTPAKRQVEGREGGNDR